jgi:hypothetical protein
MGVIKREWKGRFAIEAFLSHTVRNADAHQILRSPEARTGSLDTRSRYRMTFSSATLRALIYMTPLI